MSDPSPRGPVSWQRPDVVNAELRKAGLSRDEAARLTVLMQGLLEGRLRPGDFKRLRHGVEELRLRGDHRIFRLYYARLDNGRVALALHFHCKKKQNDRAAIALAIKRLRDWT